jgi:ABC-type multidrug transport system ATPase subunit
MNVAEDICDRVAFIVDGKICLTASPRELKLENGKRRVRVEYSGDKGTEPGSSISPLWETTRASRSHPIEEDRDDPYPGGEPR